MTTEKTSVDEVPTDRKPLNGPYNVAPQSTLKIAQFLQRIGSIKEAPAKWQEPYFPQVHSLPDS